MVEILARLDLTKTISFLDGHYLWLVGVGATFCDIYVRMFAALHKIRSPENFAMVFVDMIATMKHTIPKRRVF